MNISIHFANPNKWSILGIYSRWEVRDEVVAKQAEVSHHAGWPVRTGFYSGEARVHGVQGARAHGVSSRFAPSRGHEVWRVRAHGVAWEVLFPLVILPPSSSWSWLGSPWTWRLSLAS